MKTKKFSLSAFSFSGLMMAGGAACFMTGCSPGGSHNGTSEHIAAGIIAASNLPPTEKAEQLALAAEKLLDAQGFLQARDINDEALKQDPTNLRASFIKTALAPILLEKGLLIRLQPLAQQHPLAARNLSLEIAKTKAAPDSAFNRFLLDGQPDIRTEAELQLLLDKYYVAIDQVRLFARAHRSDELTIKAGSVLIPNLSRRYAEACQITQNAKLDYELTCPKPITRTEVTLNGADFEIIQDMAAYIEMMVAFSNGYDLSGSVAVARTKMGQDDVQAADLLPGLIRNPAFGKLRRQQALTKIKDMGLDVVTGLRYVMNHQSELCPTGDTSARNRPGFLINEGLCLQQGLLPYAQTLEDIVNNVPQATKIVVNGVESVTQANYMTPLDRPLADLNKIGPVMFDHCKNLIHVGDATLGGVFAAGDANSVLVSGARDCR